MAFLEVCIPSCFDGFERMDHAMKPQKPLAQIPRKTARHSPFFLGDALVLAQRYKGAVLREIREISSSAKILGGAEVVQRTQQRGTMKRW